jgi:diaminopimelate decarboxylase
MEDSIMKSDNLEEQKTGSVSRHPYQPPKFEHIPVKAWNSITPMNQKGHYRETIDDVEIRSIVNSYGSPVVIISERTLRTRYRQMRSAFKAYYPDTIVAWSYKTNYLSAVCTIFRTEGAWAEVVSGFEYAIARDLGVPGPEIIFNGPYKTDSELRRAVEDGARIHADSFEELDQLKKLARELNKKIEIGIRINCHLNYPPWSKFGFSFEDGQAYEAILLAQKEGLLCVNGFHLHGGTYITDTTIYTTAIEKLLSLAMDLEASTDFELKYLDLGGGYASKNTLHDQFLRGEAICPTYEQYAEAVCTPFLKQLPRLKRHPNLIIEPGRSIVDDGLSLVTTVVSSKHLSTGHRAIIVDAGVNILPTAYWYKHEMVALTHGPAPEEKIDVLGGLCMNIDVLCTNVSMPAVKKGDLILIKSTGAYNFSQSMQFIYTRPNYVLINSGEVYPVRNAENHLYIRVPETLPEHLRTDENRHASFLTSTIDKPAE